MTQEYVDQLTANYEGVDKFYFTVDGTAFLRMDDAVVYGKKLGNGEIKSVAHGGKVADAVLEVANDIPAPVVADEAASEEPKPLDEMSAKELKALCDAKGITYDAKATKAALIEALNAFDAAIVKTTGEATEPQA
jgi:hypothetical protein